jgi:CRISPR-associated protein Csc1
MRIYRCQLTLLEATFFSSREVSATYQTEPVIGNIALAYAFNFCRSPYFNDGVIHYKAHLSALNEQGLYVTPGTIIGQPRFSLGQFNAQPDAYWYAMGAGTIVTRPDDGWAVGAGKTWRIARPGASPVKVQAETRPQSLNPLTILRYIRLGKFMSKAQVEVTEMPFEIVESETARLPLLLNPADLPADMPLTIFDLINIPPAPLVRNAHLGGRFYKLKDGTLLPAGMHFGVEALP